MLMNIKCSTVASISVHLEFEDKSVKDVIIGLNDLISVDYNHNGCRKHFDGRVISINTNGLDPKGWAIILDGSGCFDSDQVRFSPMNILDIHMLRKADSTRFVESTNDITRVIGIRVVKDRMQYTKDGVTWRNIKIDIPNVIKPHVDYEDSVKDEGNCDDDLSTEDFIEDEVY